MSGYIKYFENGGKSMSFLIKDKEVQKNIIKFEMWLKINWVLNFIVNLFMKKKTYKVKIKEFHGVAKRNFLSNALSEENMHYTCIACITIVSVMKIGKKKTLSTSLLRRVQV